MIVHSSQLQISSHWVNMKTASALVSLTLYFLIILSWFSSPSSWCLSSLPSYWSLQCLVDTLLVRSATLSTRLSRHTRNSAPRLMRRSAALRMSSSALLPTRNSAPQPRSSNAPRPMRRSAPQFTRTSALHPMRTSAPQLMKNTARLPISRIAPQLTKSSAQPLMSTSAPQPTSRNAPHQHMARTPR